MVFHLKSLVGEVSVYVRIGVSKTGGCVLLYFCEGGVDILLFPANASNQLFVWRLVWGCSGDLIYFILKDLYGLQTHHGPFYPLYLVA